jgi:hypothetical protein
MTCCTVPSNHGTKLLSPLNSTDFGGLNPVQFTGKRSLNLSASVESIGVVTPAEFGAMSANSG